MNDSVEDTLKDMLKDTPKKINHRSEAIVELTESICDSINSSRLTREDLALLLSVDIKTMDGYLDGSANITLEKLLDLCYYLHLTLDITLDESD